FRNVDTSQTRVVLIEAQGRVLPSMSERASARALRDLERMNVEVLLRSQVTEINQSEVAMGPRQIPTRNVFWAAGVEAAKLNRSLGVELDRAGRVKVNPDCSVPGYPAVFVIGDAAHLVSSQHPNPVPGVAQAAMQMGDFVARRIRLAITQNPKAMSPAMFRYRDKGSMAAIGRARAIADIGGFTFGGVGAWLVWSLVHILFLVGFRNKLFVMLSWVWNYLVSTKGARLITGESRLSIRQPLLTGTNGPRESVR
ncbi:MAG: NAD(P)/FAD-dependent oxidoreductase, partial [Myxococcales bacterium]